MSNPLVSTASVVSSKKGTPTTGLYPPAPAPDTNPGQVAGSGMAGGGNRVPSGVPSNEKCTPDSPGGCSSF